MLDIGQVAYSYMLKGSFSQPQLFIVDGNGIIYNHFEYVPSNHDIFEGNGLMNELDRLMGMGIPAAEEIGFCAVIPILLATYGTVFVAEIVGDKLLYTTGRPCHPLPHGPIVMGMTLAFMAKMAVAVLVGKAISTLPPFARSRHYRDQLLRDRCRPVAQAGHREVRKVEHPASRAAMVSFAAIFFSEWGTSARSPRPPCPRSSACP